MKDRNQEVRRQIVLGRLVDDAGLPAAVEDDLAALFGGLLRLADAAKGDPEGALALWRARLRDGPEWEGECLIQRGPSETSSGS